MTPLTSVGLTIVAIAMVAIFVVPRRWAPAPMLIVTCYMVLSQGVLLGPFNFFSIRLVILAGMVRVLVRREFRGVTPSPIDRVMLIWGASMLAASYFHTDPSATLTYNGGVVFNTWGTYVLLRAFCRSVEDAIFLCRTTIWLLVPVAIEMVHEKVAVSNLFSILGGVPDVPNIREGRIRAQGPFAHSILAGTVGAVALPLCFGLWHRYKFTTLMGLAACMTIVITSASSGPLLSAIAAVLALLIWPMRRRMRLIRHGLVSIYLALAMVMEAPPYYLMGRIDLSGGSTGYHRARLIESALEHLGEWWLAGTDVTRHWMATGVTWSPFHTDITNHYLAIGVMGGMPSMLLFIWVLVKGFSAVGAAVKDPSERHPELRFFFWSLGASLFAHTATCISVSYFDQSFVFIYITLAAIASLGSHLHAGATAPQPNALPGQWVPGMAAERLAARP